MTKIGSSSILTGTNFAVNANRGAMMRVGSSIRLTRAATRSFVSSLSSSFEWSSVGSVFRAKLPPSTTNINGMATPPLCVIALVTEFLKKEPFVKKNLCRSGIEATRIAASIAQRGGFMNDQTPSKNVLSAEPALFNPCCNGPGKASKADIDSLEMDL